MVTSNLGGVGGIDVDENGVEIPRTGKAKKEVRFHNVTTLQDGTMLDLVMTNLTQYVAKPTTGQDMNGRKECLGRLNILAPGDVQIRFAFVLHGTDELAPAATKHYFTVLDFDKSGAGMTEEVIVDQSFEAIAQTDMPWSRDASGRYVFKAKPQSIEIPNPTDPYDLSPEQQNAAVGLQYFETSEWIVEFKAEVVGDATASGGRNFLFAGKTQLQHVATPEPVPTPAPTPPTPAPTPVPTTPAPTPCPVPVVCNCLKDPIAPYDYYVDWNMCTSGMEIGPGGLPIRYKNVAPSMDLVLTNLTSYAALAPEKNGRSGCLGQLNIAAPGNAQIKFALVKEGTNTPVPLGPTYEMTVFDVDASKRGMTEVVGVSKYSSIEAVALKPNVVGHNAWFRATDVEVENPDTNNLNNLTPAQIDASFSVSYTGTSEWVVQFHAEQGGRKTGGRNFFFSGTSCASANQHECHCPV